jgi:hypothetical protein
VKPGEESTERPAGREKGLADGLFACGSSRRGHPLVLGLGMKVGHLALGEVVGDERVHGVSLLDGVAGRSPHVKEEVGGADGL